MNKVFTQRRLMFPFVTALVVLAICLAARHGERLYAGKSLHQLSQALQKVSFRVSDQSGIELETTNAITAAILSAGTNAVPWLRAELTCHDSKFQKWRYWIYRLPQPLEDLALKIPVVSPSLTSGERHLNAGLVALVLGDTAKEVAPELGALLNSERRNCAYAVALGRMGTDGLPDLIRGVACEEDSFESLLTMEWTSTDLTPALPVLLFELTNDLPIWSVQRVLIRMDACSNEIIHIAHAAQSSPSPRVREKAGEMLQMYELRSQGLGPHLGQKAYRLTVSRSGCGVGFLDDTHPTQPP